MLDKTRREYLAGIGAAGSLLIAGCSGGSNNGGSNGGNGDNQSTPTPQLTDFVELVDHEFQYSSAGFELFVTVRNVSDQQLPLINVSSNLYSGDTRVDNSSINISELPPETEDTADMTFLTAEPPDLEQVDSYDITVQTAPETTSYERTYEFDEFTFPPE